MDAVRHAGTTRQNQGRQMLISVANKLQNRDALGGRKIEIDDCCVIFPILKHGNCLMNATGSINGIMLCLETSLQHADEPGFIFSDENIHGYSYGRGNHEKYGEEIECIQTAKECQRKSLSKHNYFPNRIRICADVKLIAVIPSMAAAIVESPRENPTLNYGCVIFSGRTSSSNSCAVKYPSFS